MNETQKRLKCPKWQVTARALNKSDKKSEIGIRKRAEMGFETRANGRERWISGDMRWKTVPQMSGCDRKRSVADGRQLSADKNWGPIYKESYAGKLKQNLGWHIR